MDNANSGKTPAPLHLPIKVRGQVVATLDAWPHEEALNAEAKSLLNTIAERLGQTLENARLFEETRQRAEVERLVAEISRHLRETLDVETILESAAVDFRRALKLGEAEIRLGNPTSPNPNGNGSNHNEPPT